MFTTFEEDLETQEKKHKKFVKYDLRILVVLLVVLVFIIVENFFLKADYKAVSEPKVGIPSAISECGKSILNVAETYHKNSGDSGGVAAVDAAKLSFDTAIGYFGKVVKKGTKDDAIVTVIDSCYRTAIRFHTVLTAQKNLQIAGVSIPMINNLEKDIKHLRVIIDSLVTGIDAYNSAGFCLKFSWLTPYPGQIEYTHTDLPEVQILQDTSAAVKTNTQ